jgi:uncharacterized protein (DUF983 family)
VKLSHALRGHCPRCGERRIFARWGELVEHCPRCGYGFEREEGYWVGALIVNIAAAQLLAMAVLLGGLALFWPDVPWAGLLAVGIPAIAIVPVWLYPRTKTIWVWLDNRIHPYER